MSKNILQNFCRMFLCAVIPMFYTSCNNQPKTHTTPWGTEINIEDSDIGKDQSTDSINAPTFSLEDILKSEQLIVLTLYGPESYYEYHGKGLGVNYLLAEKFAEHLGVTVRIDVCRDTVDMLERLKNGEGDIIAVPVRKSRQNGFLACGVQTMSRINGKTKEEGSWLVSKNSDHLASAINEWYRPQMYADVQKEQEYMLTSGSVTRRVYPFMISAEKGTISSYDHLFKKYASIAGMDWILMAAQCYQESCFDPLAKSWAGACGLMQIMPATADHLQLPRNRMYDPESNIAASARYMRELQQHFKDVPNPSERMKFALAAYNGGFFHIRDAMALTKKYGGSWQRWEDVKRYVLALSQSQFYTDAVVKYGYMRGSETANYVDMISDRHQQYRRALRTGTKVESSVKKPKSTLPVPHTKDTGIDAASTHKRDGKNKWRKD